MPEFDNTNRGSIWKNEKKREGKQDPDFTGNMNVGGHDYWVSAWKRKADASDRAPALSFSVKLKDGKPSATANPPSQTQKSQVYDDMDDEISF